MNFDKKHKTSFNYKPEDFMKKNYLYFTYTSLQLINHNQVMRKQRRFRSISFILTLYYPRESYTSILYFILIH